MTYFFPPFLGAVTATPRARAALAFPMKKEPARGARDSALHVEEVRVGLDLDDLEVAGTVRRDVAHVAAEPLAREQTTGALVRRHGSGVAPALGAVAAEAAGEVVALDDARERKGGGQEHGSFGRR